MCSKYFWMIYNTENIHNSGLKICLLTKWYYCLAPLFRQTGGKRVIVAHAIMASPIHPDKYEILNRYISILRANRRVISFYVEHGLMLNLWLHYLYRKPSGWPTKHIQVDCNEMRHTSISWLGMRKANGFQGGQVRGVVSS